MLRLKELAQTLFPSKYARCGNCGSSKNLETINLLGVFGKVPDIVIKASGSSEIFETIPVPGAPDKGYSIVLCPKHLAVFNQQVNATAFKYTAHPVIRDGVALILEGLNDLYGLDLEQEDFDTTPERVARMYAELCIGLSETPEKYLAVQSPAPEPPSLIVTRRIDFDSLCMHHLAVISGHTYIGYIPDKVIVGLSKLGRVVEAFAKRPQLQERMTNEIADCIQEVLKPKGVIVLVMAQHGCMSSRGILKRNAETATSAVRGVFLSNTAGCKDEFFNIIRMREA